MMGGLRESIPASHDPAGAPSRAACCTTAHAPMISKRRSVRSPIFGSSPEFLFAAGGSLQWCQPEPRRNIAPLLETLSRRGQSGQRRCRHRSDPGDGRQPSRNLVLLRTTSDLDIELLDPAIQRSQDPNQDAECKSGGFRQAGCCILDVRDQLGNAVGTSSDNAPISARCSRSALIACVRCHTIRSRVRNTIALALHGREPHQRPLRGADPPWDQRQVVMQIVKYESGEPLLRAA
jgi:hypothetical protein